MNSLTSALSFGSSAPSMDSMAPDSASDQCCCTEERHYDNYRRSAHIKPMPLLVCRATLDLL